MSSKPGSKSGPKSGSKPQYPHSGAASNRRPAPKKRFPLDGQEYAGRSPKDKKPHAQADGFLDDPVAGHAPHHTEGASEIPLLVGVKPVLEMLQSSPERVDTVFIRKGRHGKDMETAVDLCRKGKVRFSLLEPQAFAKQFGGAHHQGIAARLFEAGYTDIDKLLGGIMDAPLPLAVVLDQVKDPGNAGTLARTLYALGGAGLIIPRNNSVYLGAGAARAAAGALHKLPVARVGSLSQAIDSAVRQGISIYGAASASKGQTIPVESIFSITPRFPALLLLGSEESGIRPTIEKRCTALVSIPMQRPFDSLNVAQAGAICIASFLRYHLNGK